MRSLSRPLLFSRILGLRCAVAFAAPCLRFSLAVAPRESRIPTRQSLIGVQNLHAAVLTFFAICLSTFWAGCGGGGSSQSCGGSLAAPLTGPGGLTVALSGISNGSQIPCAGLSGGGTCSFTADFSVSQLTQPVTAELAVQICTDADGNSFASENPGQSPVFIQPDQIPLTSGSTGGSLDGTLGPPVSSQVRFALQVDLLNSSGQTIASSQPVINLAPE